MYIVIDKKMERDGSNSFFLDYLQAHITNVIKLGPIIDSVGGTGSLVEQLGQ